MYKKINGKSILFSFYIIFLYTSSFASSSIDIALEKKLYNSHIWKALLHIRDGNPKINNETFLLSYDNFSLQNELIKTIQDFENGRNICKYPARYLWLKEELVNNNFKEFNCIKFQNYIEKTNPNDIELIFASENVTSPSSMMGHVFFKLKSKQENNKTKQNAVSFFTVIDTFNIPLLITKSTITGMKGYFILNPYKTQISKYLYEEKRSIWEYKLKLTEFQKKLIYYHFWELKDINMTYYFTGFNCATMIDDILSLTKDDYINENSLWVTPKDVIKNAEKNDLIENTKMIPSIEWELNMLVDNINIDKRNQIIDLLKNKDFNKLFNFNYSKDLESKDLEKEFILSYAKYLFLNKNSITNEEYLNIINVVKQTEDFSIDIKKYKNPLKTFDDSQVSLSYLRNEDKNSLGLSFLGASNTIFDDNREYFSESSLKIGEINLLLDKDNIHINSINIYDMKSLIPWNNITKELSKEFRFSYEKHYDNNLDEINVLNISGGAGLSYKIHNDILVYNLGKIGAGGNFEKAYPYTSFETGIIIYEILNMKTVLSHEFIYNQDNSDDMYQNIQINQSFFINKKIRMDLNFNEKINTDFNKESMMLKFNYFF
jgi:hypothetical protein